MNVIGTRPDGWWRNRRRAAVRLVEQLETWASVNGHRVTVVFERPPSPPIHSPVVAVAYAPRAASNSADDEIVRLVAAAERTEPVIVVTSDASLAERVRTLNASVRSAAAFRDVIDPLCPGDSSEE